MGIAKARWTVLVCVVFFSGAVNGDIKRDLNQIRDAFTTPLLDCLANNKVHPGANIKIHRDKLFPNQGVLLWGEEEPDNYAYWVLNQQFLNFEERLENPQFFGDFFTQLEKSPPPIDFSARHQMPPAVDALNKIAIRKFMNLARDHKGAECLVEFLESEAVNSDETREKKLKAQGKEMWSNVTSVGTLMRKKVADNLCPIIANEMKKQVSTAVQGAISCDTENVDKCILLSPLEHEQVASKTLTSYMNAKLRAANEPFKDDGHFATAPLDELIATLGVIEEGNEKTEDYLENLQRPYKINLFRAMGHKYVDSAEHKHGGYFINQTVSVLQLSEGTVEKIAEAVCGLVPEAGAAICAVVEEVINASWNFGVVPGIESWVKTEIHDYINISMDNLQNESDGVNVDPKESYCVTKDDDGALDDKFKEMVLKFEQDVGADVLRQNLSVHLVDILEETQRFADNARTMSIAN